MSTYLICPECKKQVQTLASAVVDGVYLSKRCNNCLNIPVNRPHSGAKEYDRNRQRTNFRKDIVQAVVNDKINPDFVKAYPDKARARFTDKEIEDTMRGHSV